jgi:HSP20 family molecular chaperone IbpA
VIQVNIRKETVKMKKNRYLDLVTSIDVLNTLNGGVSEPHVSNFERDQGREVRLYVPSIDREAIHVEIHNNTLTVYYYISIASTDKLIQVPQVVYSKIVPYFIDIGKINAMFEEEELVVRLPFNKLANGYHRKLRINEN